MLETNKYANSTLYYKFFIKSNASADEIHTKVFSLIKSFDYIDTIRLMKELNYEYHDGLPTAERLKGVLEYLLNKLYNAIVGGVPDYWSKTGRFTVRSHQFYNGWMIELVRDF